jgi:hypothetical protein
VEVQEAAEDKVTQVRVLLLVVLEPQTKVLLAEQALQQALHLLLAVEVRVEQVQMV